MENTKECPECMGSGFIGKLYPTGHTEVTCEVCHGVGTIDSEVGRDKGMIKAIPIVGTFKITASECQHEFKDYFGFSESYLYCVKCDQRER